MLNKCKINSLAVTNQVGHFCNTTVVFGQVFLTLKSVNHIRQDLQIYWFAITLVCFFEYTQLFGKKIFNRFEMEKIVLILIYLSWFSSSLLHLILCVYFFCNVHTTIMNLAYLILHNPQLAG